MNVIYVAFKFSMIVDFKEVRKLNEVQHMSSARKEVVGVKVVVVFTYFNAKNGWT